MSAVAEPVQIGIEGLAPVDEPHAALAIAGRLARRAELRISTNGRPHLVVELRQRSQADCLSFVATYHGTSDEIPELEEQVRRMSAGTPLMVRGAGLELVDAGDDEHHVERHLRLVEVTFIRELSFANPAEAALL